MEHHIKCTKFGIQFFYSLYWDSNPSL